MPIYEYRCTACRREFEYEHSMNDPDRATCEACGTDTLERLISWTSVRSNNWKAALYKDNPKEAMRGTHAVDVGRSQRFTGNDAAVAGDVIASPTATPNPTASTTPTPSTTPTAAADTDDDSKKPAT
jgi:putative FmdB family regulatory protein